jgi:hypothetical protein
MICLASHPTMVESAGALACREGVKSRPGVRRPTIDPRKADVPCTTATNTTNTTNTTNNDALNMIDMGRCLCVFCLEIRAKEVDARNLLNVSLWTDGGQT